MKKDAKTPRDKIVAFPLAKDLLPPALLGRQREPALLKKALAFGEPKTPPPSETHSFLKSRFDEVLLGQEALIPVDQTKSFREPNYDYFQAAERQRPLWKRAGEFFALSRAIKNGRFAPPALFRDDSQIRPARENGLPRSRDDLEVVLGGGQKLQRVKVKVCEFALKEESDEVFTARLSEVDNKKGKASTKKAVQVN